MSNRDDLERILIEHKERNAAMHGNSISIPIQPSKPNPPRFSTDTIMFQDGTHQIEIYDKEFLCVRERGNTFAGTMDKAINSFSVYVERIYREGVTYKNILESNIATHRLNQD